MILFDPLGRVTVCTESARVVDSVFLIIRTDFPEMYFEDGTGRICVFRTSAQAIRFRDTRLNSNYGVYEFYSPDAVLLLSRPHICVSENYDGSVL